MDAVFRKQKKSLKCNKNFDLLSLKVWFIKPISKNLYATAHYSKRFHTLTYHSNTMINTLMLQKVNYSKLWFDKNKYSIFVCVATVFEYIINVSIACRFKSFTNKSNSLLLWTYFSVNDFTKGLSNLERSLPYTCIYDNLFWYAWQNSHFECEYNLAHVDCLKKNKVITQTTCIN